MALASRATMVLRTLARQLSGQIIRHRNHVRLGRFGSATQIQSLEPRTLLSATITGIIYRDISGSRTYEPADPPLAGWTIYLDLNHDGVRDANEPTAISDATGRYTFTGLSAGSYDVREDTLTGFQAVPTSLHSVTVTDGQTLDHVDFANQNLIDNTETGPTANQDSVNNGLPLTSPNAPSSSIALSGKYVVAVNNNSITFYRREDYFQLATESLSTFFVGQPNAASATNPQVFFDPAASRFFVVAVANSPTGSQLLFASSGRKNSPNTSVWRYHSIDVQATTGTALFTGRPSISIDNTAIYIASDLTDSTGAFAASRLWILNKSRAYSTKANIINVYDPSAELSLPEDLPGIHAVVYSGKQIHRIGMSYFAVNAPSSSGDLLDIIRVRRSLNKPIFSLQAIAKPTDISISASTALPPAPQPAAPGGSRGIDTNTAPMEAVWRGSYLWVANTYVPTTGPDAGVAQVYWFEISIKNQNYQLVDDGNVSGSLLAPGTSTFAPSIAIDRDNYMALGFSASGPGLYPGAYVVGRKTNDPPHTLRAAYALTAGQTDYSASFESSGLIDWGHNTTVLDVRDPNRFWVFNHYAADPSSPTGPWGQTLISFRLPPRHFPVVD